MAIPDNSPLNSRHKVNLGLWSHGIWIGNGSFCIVKCFQNVDFDDILFGECIYSCLIMGNTVVILPGLVGAGTLSPGVGPRALIVVVIGEPGKARDEVEYCGNGGFGWS